VATANDSATGAIRTRIRDASHCDVAPLPGVEAPATDPYPGRGCEDVDGDGTAGLDDVVELLFALDRLPDDPATLDAFDLDGDRDVDFEDVVTLLFRL
jgi:hypothetical protein